MVRSFTSFSLSSSLTSTKALSYSASYSTWTNRLQNDCSKLWTLLQTNCLIWLMLSQILQPPGVPVEILRSAQACFDKQSSTREEASEQNSIWLNFKNLTTSGWYSFLPFVIVIGLISILLMFCSTCSVLEKNLTTSGWYSFLSFVIVIGLVSVVLLTIPMKINSSSLFRRTFFLVFKTESSSRFPFLTTTML